MRVCVCACACTYIYISLLSFITCILIRNMTYYHDHKCRYVYINVSQHTAEVDAENDDGPGGGFQRVLFDRSPDREERRWQVER